MVRNARGLCGRGALAMATLSLVVGALWPSASFASSDVTPPVLQEYIAGTTFVDTATDSASVPVTVRVTDDSSGAQAPMVVAQLSGTSQQIGPIQMSLLSGDSTDGRWSAVFSFAPSDSTGTWNLVLYPLRDNAGNQAGLGDPSYFATVGSVDVEHYPPPVTSVVANAYDQSADVKWDQPGGGGPPGPGPTCTVTASPGGQTAQTSCATGEVVVVGLTNGVAYTFTATRTDSTGTSQPSLPSTAVTPSGQPAPPPSVSVTPGDAAATVSWQPADANGSPITGYTVYASVLNAGPGAYQSWSAPADATSLDVTGLTNGENYTFSVTATNINGRSQSTTPTSGLGTVPSALPTAPSNVVAVAGNAAVTVHWNPSTATYAAVKYYVVRAYPSGPSYTLLPPTTSFTVQGLTNGKAYTFTVTAVDAYGRSTTPATSRVVMPVGPPGAAKFVASVLGRALTLKWGIAAPNGSPVTKYAIRLNGRTYWFPARVHTFRITFPGPMRSQPALMAYNALGRGTVSYVKFWVH